MKKRVVDGSIVVVLGGLLLLLLPAHDGYSLTGEYWRFGTPYVSFELKRGIQDTRLGSEATWIFPSLGLVLNLLFWGLLAYLTQRICSRAAACSEQDVADHGLRNWGLCQMGWIAVLNTWGFWTTGIKAAIDLSHDDAYVGAVRLLLLVFSSAVVALLARQGFKTTSQRSPKVAALQLCIFIALALSSSAFRNLAPVAFH